MAKAPQKHSSPVNGRELATRVIVRVLRDQAYVSRALDAELSRHPGLDARERSLCTELCYGSLRSYGFLRAQLEQRTKKGLGKDPELLAALVVAAYQVLLLDRVPASAAVNQAVQLVRRTRGQRVAGFANAVLRGLAREGQQVTREQAILESAPGWLKQRLSDRFGAEECAALLGALDAPAPLVARLVAASALPEGFEQARACRWVPGAYVLPAPLPPDERAKGRWVVQEEGAQLIAWALGACPGERVLDACGGRGAKASLIWELMQQRGSLWVADAFPNKLSQLRQDFERLGFPEPETAAVDWTRGQGDIPGDFDRVLVDAPCTGSGTLRKRPEILMRLQPEDPARMGQLQEAIVRSVSTRLKPGGRLLYAVCSVFEEECEAVVARLSDLLTPVPFDSEVAQRVAGAGSVAFRLLPGQHATDGYFLASLQKG